MTNMERKSIMNNTSLFMKVEDVAKELGISKSHAYKIMRLLNAELAEKGYITISGRVNRKYLEEKIYGTGNSVLKEDVV